MIGSGAAIFGCEGLSLTAAERDFFRDYDPLGFIIFARNVANPQQLSRLTAELRDSVGRYAPILVDQEGGRVQRLRAPYWSEWAAPLDTVEQAGANAAHAMALRSMVIAAELRAVGIDANCAPVADIGGPRTHPFLRNRCYGQDAATVTKIARAVADAHLEMGVLPVVKHMPGHGRSINDTHLDLPTVTTDRATLNATDFAPFRALADLPMAMTAHIIFSAYDSLPATQSPAMIQAIRDEIGFKGLLMTDDLNMQALEGTLGQRTARSIAAGCDIALHCKGDMAEMLEVATAAGTMTEAARARATAALAQRRPAKSVDIVALKAEFSSLLGEGAHG
ncbi:MAG: beta-N-acetylhexosaminidase [Cypionkella sp.]|uniref:beta-N-acetylhexosaminidase n=1 Tax=Cypionkella sp. TaxID=2811411 RepID=UPI002628AA7C|nr:beta-N-acetylhexosaminidase [Cypionkella sp.]MDB5661447.1 beta-N-acetylhexosaminidase [Cypionkella sp.]